MDEPQNIEFHGWRFIVQAERTTQAYAASVRRGAGECSCAYCRNLVAQRAREYPRELVQFLQSVGVDPFKEAEVWEAGPLQGGYTYNAGWWHFIGEVEVNGQPVEMETEPNGRAKEWNLLFLAGKSDLKLETLPASPLVQVEFSAKLPWVPYPSP